MHAVQFDDLIGDHSYHHRYWWSASFSFFPTPNPIPALARSSCPFVPLCVRVVHARASGRRSTPDPVVVVRCPNSDRSIQIKGRKSKEVTPAPTRSIGAREYDDPTEYY